MKLKNRSCMLAIVSLLTSSLFIVQVAEQSGPKTPNMTIHIYPSPTPENWALEQCILDINDWPLSKEWIDKWIANPEISMRSYSEIGKMQIDINNQRWPTGCGEHQEYDPATETWKTYYDDSCQWCTKARVFRTALAYLCDKDKIIRDVLKGYAYRMDTFVPIPALIGYTDYPALETTDHDLHFITGEGLVRHYDPCIAADLLDYAGFVQGTTRNPDYDPNFPCSAEYIRINPKTGLHLRPLDFYIRMDDPNQMSAGLMLCDTMKKSGIPVNGIIAPRWVCNCMVAYDYDLYTGGWIMDADPTWIWTLYGSEFYYDPIGPPPNYPGFCNHEFDTEAYACYTATDMPTVKTKCLDAQKIYANMTPCIDLWASVAVKAYKSKWDGVVNDCGCGIDDYFTFLNMYCATDDTIDWGFKSDIEALHPVCSSWLWDHKVLRLIYDPGYGREPFDRSVKYPQLFTSWESGTYTHPTEGTCTNTTYHIRTGITWHHGGPFNASDVKFTLDFKKACGEGVAWESSFIENVTNIGEYTVEVKYNYQSVYAPDIAGCCAYISRDVWMAANAARGWNYNDETCTFTPEDNRFLVRDYHPWEDNDYKPGDGKVDIMEDGTGPWVFNEYVKGEHVKLTANSNFYKTQTAIENDIKGMFHWGVGDINENSAVDIPDLFLITKAWHTSSATGGTPGDWGAWNPACDIVTDDYIDIYDLTKASINYGKCIGC